MQVLHRQVQVLHGVSGYRAACVCEWYGMGRRSSELAALDGQDHIEAQANAKCQARHRHGYKCVHWSCHIGSHAAPIEGEPKVMRRWW